MCIVVLTCYRKACLEGIYFGRIPIVDLRGLINPGLP